MEIGISWVVVIIVVSGIIGASGWIVQILLSEIKEPKLYFVKGPYVKKWGNRKYVNYDVGVKNKRTAKRCVAVVEIRRVNPNITNDLKTWSPLHWADVRYRPITTMDPVDIGMERRRLDVAFTEENKNDVFIAVGAALMGQNLPGQIILPPDEYKMRVSVSSHNGKGISKTMRLTSSDNWEDLKVEEIKNKEFK